MLSSVPIELEADVLRVRQILTNLVGNANKFTAGGRIEITVSMVNRQPCIEVADEGLADGRQDPW